MLAFAAAQDIRISQRRGWIWLALAFGVLIGSGPLAGASRAAGLDERQPIKVAAVSGVVHVSMRGRTSTVAPGDTIELPASIDTGPNGSIELREGGTLIAIAASSSIRIPVPSEPGEGLDQIIQASGNAFYSVAKRVISHLRVETPYLVAVVKGTQFDVSSLSNRTTIALFEGQLEVDASDHSDAVNLNAGQIATRYGSGRIRVLQMNTGQTLRAAAGAGDTAIPVAGRAAGAGAGASSGGPNGRLASGSLAPGGAVLPAGGLNGTGTGISTGTVPGAIGAGAAASTASTGLSSSVSLSAAPALGTTVGVGTTGVSAAAGLDTSVGVGTSGVSATAGLGTTVGVGTSGVSATAGLGTTVGVGTTGVSATAGLGTTVGVGTSGVSTGLSTGVSASLGGTAATGTTSATGTTAGVSAGASVGASTSTGVSAGVGTSVSVGGTTLGVGTSVSTGSLLGTVGGILSGVTGKPRTP